MTWVAGADGFKRGWRVILCEIETDTWLMRDVAAFSELLKLREAPAIVCVDMPIGLHEHTPPGGRACDTLARGLLGLRRSSVFSAVGRQAFACLNRADAHAASVAAGGIGIGAQAWGLAAKLREVDQAMSPELQTVVFEVHPELCFWAMNGRQPMPHAKKTGAGENGRIAVLVNGGVPKTFLDDGLGKLRGGRDDFLDACAAAWTARRVFGGAAERLPSKAERDGRGLDMAMWF
jgi:predicted RNase H-like nuclease